MQNLHFAHIFYHYRAAYSWHAYCFKVDHENSTTKITSITKTDFANELRPFFADLEVIGKNKLLLLIFNTKSLLLLKVLKIDDQFEN